MSSRRPSPAPKRIIPIKRADGEPLSRTDIQYDVLRTIFDDPHTVFTDPYAISQDSNFPLPKLNFHDLYIKAIINSSKCTKTLRDKMKDLPDFAEDFAMLSLLVNVGRINTTMSFFTGMKTAIRTYHPVPALQRTNENLQDAPRIKHILKNSLLESETNGPPSTPSDILSRAKAGQIPATSIMNLIFVLVNHSAPVGQAHFPDNIDFMDLFLRTDLSSASRAQAFLYLCYHYLESAFPTGPEDDYDNDVPVNPFFDPQRGKGPGFVSLSHDEVALENVESEEERARKESLMAVRSRILNSSNVPSGKGEGFEHDEEGSGVELAPVVELSVSKKKGTKEKKAMSNAAAKKRDDRILTTSTKKRSARHFESDEEDLPNLPLHQLQSSQHRLPSDRLRGHADTPPSHRRRYLPHVARQGDRSQPALVFLPRRTMFEHAWHVINSTDPLANSDDELGDEYDRREYTQRLEVLSRLRSQEPTPEHNGILY